MQVGGARQTRSCGLSGHCVRPKLFFFFFAEKAGFIGLRWCVCVCTHARTHAHAHYVSFAFLCVCLCVVTLKASPFEGCW